MNDLVRFLRACHEEMDLERQQRLGFDPDDSLNTLATTTENGGLLTLEFDTDGVCGIFAAGLAKNHMRYADTRACEYVWHSRPGLSTRRRVEIQKSLLAKAEKWARQHRHYLVIGTNERRPAMARLLLRAGFEPLETLYGKGY